MFGSKAFADWKKTSEHEMKLLNMIIDRLDGVSKRIDGLSKSMSRRR
jgi:hypothetical protein